MGDAPSACELPRHPRPRDIWEPWRWKSRRIAYKYFGRYPVEYLHVACSYEREKDAYKECKSAVGDSELCKRYVKARRYTPLCWAYRETELETLCPVVVVDLDVGTVYAMIPRVRSGEVDVYAFDVVAHRQLIDTFTSLGIIRPDSYVFVYAVHGNEVVGWYRKQTSLPVAVDNEYIVPIELMWKRTAVKHYKYYGAYEWGMVQRVCQSADDRYALDQCYLYCDIEYGEKPIKLALCKLTCDKLMDVRRKTPLCWAYYAGLGDKHSVFVETSDAAYAFLPSRFFERVHIHAFARRLTGEFIKLAEELHLIHTRCIDVYEVYDYVVHSKQTTCKEES